MSDIIQLLPDSVANQIAAGEVIQRPASAVKELLENAVDAGSTNIQLIIKDSGKTLIQIIDNGSGMSQTDARMSFERHATSKIRKADDLFAIRTFGFRGEALASVAAIAQVELKTRKHEEPIGTSIRIEGSDFISQEAVSTSPGTSISIKNLFYNVPARRNFLKSNPVEAKHIVAEFERVALAQPQVTMSLNLNDYEVYQLPESNIRQRIVNYYGANYNEVLVPVKEETSLLKISGFVGKPQHARKTRGEQFIFVNGRYIKDAYLHHAITNAYEELLPHGSFPSYWLFLSIEPSKVDINIHPTKTEIKFEDERSVYAIVRASVKHALGQYSVMPSIDFNVETSFDIPQAMKNQPPVQPSIKVDPGYNPFRLSPSPPPSNAPDFKEREQLAKLYQDAQQDASTLLANISSNETLPLDANWKEELKSEQAEENLFQIHEKFVVASIKNGLAFIDQQAASERILYERYIHQLESQTGYSQQSLFPQMLELSAGDAFLLQELLPEMHKLGFDIKEFGTNSFVVHGNPPDVLAGDEKKTIERILEHYKSSYHLKPDKKESLLRAFAKTKSIKAGKKLDKIEMKQIIEQLFQCEKPYLNIDGKPCLVILNLDEINRMFK